MRRQTRESRGRGWTYWMALAALVWQMSAHAEVQLRFAHASTGGPDKVAIDQAIKGFEKAHMGVKIKQIAMDDDVYQDMGLLSMFTSGNPPDIYFQWGGWLVGEYARQGRALDLTEALAEEGWKDQFLPNIWPGATHEGKIYMIPTDISVTTLLWYNKKVFIDLKLEVPRDWPAFLEVCAKLKAAGKVPISFGNQELWPAGNWVAHLVSRVAGEEIYRKVLSCEPGASFLHPGFVKAFSMVKEMADKGYFNQGPNGTSDTEAEMLFFNGLSAIHPIGSWLIASAQNSAPEGFSMDVFNAPQIPEGQGDQTSVVALSTGYMVYAATSHPQEAVQFLRHLTTVDVQKAFVQAGVYSSVQGAIAQDSSPPQLLKVMEIYSKAGQQVPAPDVGFDLEVSDAFLEAASAVLDGSASATEALSRCEASVKRRRHP